MSADHEPEGQLLPAQEAPLVPVPQPSRPVDRAQSTAAGSVITGPIMPKTTYASPMSYIGFTRRLLAWRRRTSAHGTTQAILAWTSAVLAAVLMYAFLIVWYLIIFVAFGLFTFPYRFVRRSHRKQEALQRQQLATMQAMLIQQQMHDTPTGQDAPTPPHSAA